MESHKRASSHLVRGQPESKVIPVGVEEESVRMAGVQTT